VNKFNQLRKTKVIAIKGFDENLYRLVKTLASLEGRTVVSVFEEAIRDWLRKRGDFEEVMLWVKLDRYYDENLKAFKESELSSKEGLRGYALACDGELIGTFANYGDVLKEIREKCKVHALIIKLPYREEGEVELGLPW